MIGGLKRGGDLQDADKRNIFVAENSVTQQEKAFIVVSLHVCFETFCLVTVSFLISRMAVLINNAVNK